MARITIDDQSYEVADGRTILQALDDLGLLMNGVDVPHYCWHPKLSIDGSCRLCQVEVEGFPKLQIACNTPVKDGMLIRTQNERVRTAREGVMELLLVNHPLDCPICDQAGECKLQDYAFEYGAAHARTREPRRPAKKKVELGPTIVFDQERCILCRRCVRFCREVPGTGELMVHGRGDHSVIETAPGEPLENDYSMNVADICPVGALTTKDFRFKIRVWFLEDVPGVCTGCANGCNVHLGVANNRVYRYVPRRNDAVNETWMCDEGRLSYKRIGGEDRLREPQLRGADGRLVVAAFDVAIEEAAARIRRAIDSSGPGVVVALASPHATNEDLFTLRRLLEVLGTSSAAGVAVKSGRSDELLIKAEKAANATGARALGFGAPGPVLDRIRGGGARVLIALGHDVLDPVFGASEELFRSLDTLILLDTHHSALERVAHVVLPARVAAEKLGTLTNHAGRVQRVEPGVEPAHLAYSEGETLLRLARAIGLVLFEGRASAARSEPEASGVRGPAARSAAEASGVVQWDPRAVSRAIGAAVPAFAGVDIDSVGAAGLPLRGPGA